MYETLDLNVKGPDRFIKVKFKTDNSNCVKKKNFLEMEILKHLKDKI